VAVVARVERPPFNKGSQSQAFTRHEQQSRGSSAIARVANRYGGKFLQMRGVERPPLKKPPSSESTLAQPSGTKL
jgi:hypothetical protein